MSRTGMGLTGPGIVFDAIYKLGWGWCFVIGLAVPAGLIAVSYLFEDRHDKRGQKTIMPIFKGQSRAFMPGEFLLAPAFAGFVYLIKYLPDTGWWQSWLWPSAVIAIVIAIIIAFRVAIDAPHYDKSKGSSADCPSWWYHTIMLFTYMAFIVIVAVPVVTSSSWWLFGTLFGAVVVFGTLYLWAQSSHNPAVRGSVPYVSGIAFFLVWIGAICLVPGDVAMRTIDGIALACVLGWFFCDVYDMFNEQKMDRKLMHPVWLRPWRASHYR